MKRHTYFDGTSYQPLTSKVECVQRLGELEDAMEEMRCFVLPEFPQEMGNILQPLKLQSALQSELMKYELRMEHDPKKISILDYTIMHGLAKLLKAEAEQVLVEMGEK